MANAVQPLLTKFSVLRTGEVQIPGNYDQGSQVWVVQTKEGVQPIVALDSECPVEELLTKTDAAPEQDDPNVASLLELTTKTSMQAERDDIDPRMSVLDLITLTKVGGERPDVA